ncbi:MAG: branched-chain amino acid ABC transporter permease [Spirochaetota bacterium]
MLLLQAVILGIPMGALYGLMGFGIALIFRSVGVMNFAHGNGGMIGAFTAFSVYLTSGSFALAVVVGLVVGAAIGVAMDEVLMKRVKGLSHASMIILTLGVLMILEGSAFIVWGTEPISFPRLYTGPPLIVQVGDGMLVAAANDVAITIVAVAVSLALAIFLKFTRFGTGTRARAQNELGAKVVGINIRVIDAIVWGIGVGLAALVALLVAPKTSITPTMLVNFQLYGLTAAVLGGFTSFFGAIVGGFILGILEKLIVFGVDALLDAAGATGVNVADYQLSIILIIIVLMLVFKPSGLFGARFTGKV